MSTGTTRTWPARRVTLDRGTLIGQLNREWLRLRTSPENSSLLSSWSRGEPILAAFPTLADIEAALAVNADPEYTDAVLLALLRLATHQEAGAGPDADLAARTVLQLMLPKAVRIARTQRCVPDRDERDAITVACLYEVICTYPVDRRTRHVAANLGLTTLQRVRRTVLRSHVTSFDVELLSNPPAGQLDHLPDQQAEPAPAAQIADLLAWALATHVLAAQEADLLARRYRDGAPTAAALGAQLGLSPDALKQRCSRAIRKLTSAAPAYAA